MKKVLLVSILSGFTLFATSSFASSMNKEKLVNEHHQANMLIHDFAKIDHKKKGKVSKDEVSAFLAQHKKAEEARISRLEKRLKSEKNSKTKAKLEKRLENMKKSAEFTADEAFEAFDINKDGYLTKVEIKAARKKISSELRAAHKLEKGKSKLKAEKHKLSGLMDKALKD